MTGSEQGNGFKKTVSVKKHYKFVIIINGFVFSRDKLSFLFITTNL